MCSIHTEDDLDEGESLPIPQETITHSAVCKCGSSEVVLIQKLYGSFCRDCFLTRMSHKMRSEFGRSRVVRDDEKVLVAFSGGCKSSAMLHLVLEGKSKRAQKKLRCTPHLVSILPPLHPLSSLLGESGDGESKGRRQERNSYVLKSFNENEGVNGDENEDRNESEDRKNHSLKDKVARNSNNLNNEGDDGVGGGDYVRFILNQLISSNLPFTLYSHQQMYKKKKEEDGRISALLRREDVRGGEGESVLEDMVALARVRMKGMVSVEEGRKALCEDKSSCEGLEKMLMKELLAEVGREMGVGKVLVGDCVESLAVRLISDVCQGRGDQLAHEMEFVDERTAAVMFLKPLRCFLSEELLLLLHLCRVNFVQKIKRASNNFKNRSIDTLTAEFLARLQEENSNTLSIVCRTGDKLSTKKKTSEDDGFKSEEDEIKCCLCKSHMSYEVNIFTSPANSSDTNNNDTNNSHTNNNDTNNNDTNDTNNNDTNNSHTNNNDTNNSHTNNNNTNNNDTNNNDTNNSHTNNNDTNCGAPSQDCCSREEECCKTRNNNKQTYLTKSDLLSCCCYACKIVVRHMADLTPLPSSVTEEAHSMLRRRKMRQCIDEFLL